MLMRISSSVIIPDKKLSYEKNRMITKENASPKVKSGICLDRIALLAFLTAKNKDARIIFYKSTNQEHLRRTLLPW